jgi:hypothetical protein
VVLSYKSPFVNKLILRFYYLPVIIAVFLIFVAYCFVITPLAYAKIVGHKFALMVMTSKQAVYKGGKCDKGLNGVLFIFFGLFILYADMVRDCVSFLRHALETDLDRRTHNKNKYLDVDKNGNPSNVNRRIFKKLLWYFGNDNNEKLVPYHVVAADIRNIINADEGINVLLYGKRN